MTTTNNDTMNVVAQHADGSATVIGTMTTPPGIKAREVLARYGFRDFDDENSDSILALAAFQDLIAWMKQAGWQPPLAHIEPTTATSTDSVQYSNSYDGEAYQGIFDSREAAAAELIADLEPGERFWVGQIKVPEIHAICIGESVEDYILDQLHQEVGEFSENFSFTTGQKTAIGQFALDTIKATGGFRCYGIRHAIEYEVADDGSCFEIVTTPERFKQLGEDWNAIEAAINAFSPADFASHGGQEAYDRIISRNRARQLDISRALDAAPFTCDEDGIIKAKTQGSAA